MTEWFPNMVSISAGQIGCLESECACTGAFEEKGRPMKYFAWLFLCAVATSAVAADVSIAGKWNISTSVAGNDGLMVCTFTQKETTLTGTCTGDDGDHAVTGKIEGSKVSWAYKTDYNGQPLTLAFSGTANSDSQFAGTIDVDPMGISGDFSAKRAK
jgi:hypothetical protein